SYRHVLLGRERGPPRGLRTIPLVVMPPTSLRHFRVHAMLYISVFIISPVLNAIQFLLAALLCFCSDLFAVCILGFPWCRRRTISPLIVIWSIPRHVWPDRPRPVEIPWHGGRRRPDPGACPRHFPDIGKR